MVSFVSSTMDHWLILNTNVYIVAIAINLLIPNMAPSIPSHAAL